MVRWYGLLSREVTTYNAYADLNETGQIINLPKSSYK